MNMNNAARIAIGAGVTMLLGWVAHGPLGNGAAFVHDLREQASIALAARGIDRLSVRFQTQPLTRVAIIEGSLTDVNRSNAVGIVGGVPGVSFARWEGNPSAPIAQAGPPKPTTPSPEATRAPVAAPKPAPVRTAATSDCQSGIDKAMGGHVLSFRPGSAWLNPQSRRIIGDVAAALKRCPGVTVEVGGYTAITGSRGVTRAMSDERVKRVRDELVAQGAPANAVIARGHESGASGPASRRILFTVRERI